MNDSQRKANPVAADVRMPAAASGSRKTYRTPECRDLGDMKSVTLKSGPSTDQSQSHPTRL